MTTIIIENRTIEVEVGGTPGPQGPTAFGDTAPLWGSPIRQNVSIATTPNAYLDRALPPGFTGLPFKPALVRGPGDVVMSVQEAFAAFAQCYPEVLEGGVAHVEAWGDNGTGELNSEELPFATIAAAKAEAGVSIIMVGDGVAAPISWRRDQGETTPLAVIVKNPGRTRMRVAGTDPAALSFSAVPGEAPVYQATVTSGAAGTTSGIHRLARADQPDAWGYPGRWRTYSSVAALKAAGTGFYSDGANDLLYVAAAGVDIDDIKHLFRAWHLDANGTSRIFCYGAPLFVCGFILDGVQGVANQYSSGGAFYPPDLWLCDYEQRFAPAHGGILTAGGRLVKLNAREHAPAVDSSNANWSTDSETGDLVRGNVWCTAAGDTAAFGTGIAQNVNAFSSHSGRHASFGCIDEGSWGPEMADTTLAGAVNLTWLVGDLARGPAAGGPSVGYRFDGKGSAGSDNRAAWLDTCGVIDEGTSLLLTAHASAKTFDTTLSPAASATTGSSAPTAYTPDAP